jgi:(4-(4-[2-(gamma-L-glutamylamino)ethyl]phenoxymethyl)furan-2-yl)methanamine synthase
MLTSMQRLELHDGGPIIGWDIGGAHVKASLLEGEHVNDIGQWPAPLWQGLSHLDDAVRSARERWPSFGQAFHAVTMSAEMTDLFPDREAGVVTLSARLARLLGPTTRFYAGEAGWLDAEQAAAQWPAVASANWLATATLATQHLSDGILMDIGSTTTDLIPIKRGTPAPLGRSDAARLKSGELVYVGVVRTPLCALARRIRFGDASYNVMHEFFATSADVFRLTGELDAAHDQYPAADERARDTAASCGRLARMIGHDAADADEDRWRQFARRWRALITAEITRNLASVIARAGLDPECPVIGAGCGLFLARDIAQMSGRPFVAFDTVIDVAPDRRGWADVCAPSVAVALLRRHARC